MKGKREQRVERQEGLLLARAGAERLVHEEGGKRLRGQAGQALQVTGRTEIQSEPTCPRSLS